MSEQILSLEPKSLWENFYSLTQIPRPSKKEQKAAEFIKEFGQKHGLETVMDDAGNVIIRKPASPGYENLKTVILQAHIDMVPQANSGIDFNFETDPIDAYVDGEWVSARQTTLGADNGIGVAAAMAILQDKKIDHGPVEVLITIDEETGMTGAFNLKPGMLKGEIFINLDTENIHEISVGCAGGIDVNALWNFSDDTQVVGDKAYTLSVAGLAGGHSGLDIHLGRGNACKLMGRLLKTIISETGARLASIQCGNMRNAIPREGFAVITIANEKVDDLNTIVNQARQIWTNELAQTEPNLKLECTQCEMPGKLIPQMVHDDVVNAMCASLNGVLRMSDTMPGVVESSTNLSIVRSGQGKIEIQCLSRSFIDSARDDIASSLESLYTLAGAKVTLDGAYPGWKPNPDSEILKIMDKTYTAVQHKQAAKVAMHAGLECGILGAVYPNWDMISVGPTIKHPHSPDEKVHIGSVNIFWNILLQVLKNIPEK